jgi:nucleoside-diphosphate-sugar epimerase
MISEKLIANESISESFNIGPDQDSFVSIGEVANVSVKAWGSDATSTKNELNWHNKLKFQDAIEWIVDWQKRKIQGESAFQISIDQSENFTSIN